MAEASIRNSSQMLAGARYGTIAKNGAAACTWQWPETNACVGGEGKALSTTATDKGSSASGVLLRPLLCVRRGDLFFFSSCASGARDLHAGCHAAPAQKRKVEWELRSTQTSPRRPTGQACCPRVAFEALPGDSHSHSPPPRLNRPRQAARCR